MFGLFKSSSSEIKMIDKVWMSTAAKYSACRQMIEVNPQCILVAWFEETFQQLGSILPGSSHANIFRAENVTAAIVSGKLVVFVEHYPLSATEQSLFKELFLTEVPVLSALDEPFFEKFNGAKTIELMKRMGMKEEEMVGNSMVSKSIRRAQEKFAVVAKFNHTATSQKLWIEKNIGNAI